MVSYHGICPVNYNHVVTFIAMKSMTIGFFSKALDFFKKIGNGIKKAVQTIWGVSKPVFDAAAPVLQTIPHPVAQAVGHGYTVARPIAERLLGRR